MAKRCFTAFWCNRLCRGVGESSLGPCQISARPTISPPFQGLGFEMGVPGALPRAVAGPRFQRSGGADAPPSREAVQAHPPAALQGRPSPSLGQRPRKMARRIQTLQGRPKPVVRPFGNELSSAPRQAHDQAALAGLVISNAHSGALPRAVAMARFQRSEAARLRHFLSRLNFHAPTAFKARYEELCAHVLGHESLYTKCRRGPGSIVVCHGGSKYCPVAVIMACGGPAGWGTEHVAPL